MSKSRYYQDQFLDQMRQEGDPLADQLIQKVFSSGQAAMIHRAMAMLESNSSPIPDSFNPQLRDYFKQNSTLPSWADETKMKQGAAFFHQYQDAILVLLGFLSLPYCYAGADGARVVYLSEQIRYNTKRRLTETGQFVLDVMDENAFQPEGAGYVSILKVRLMHATVRYHIEQKMNWDKSWGLPVNQEDMAGTNGSFSWLAVRGLRKMGYFLEADAVNSFYHLWNVIGYLLGLREELLPDNSKEAYDLDRKIAKRHFRKSEAGVGLTKALLEFFNQEPSQKFPKGFVEAYMRYLLGDKIADILEIPPSNWTKNLLSPLRYMNNFKTFFGTNTENKEGGIQQQINQETALDKVSFQIPLKLG